MSTAALAGAVVALGVPRGRAHADEAQPTPSPPSLVHPIYAQVPDAPDRDVTRRTFAAAAALTAWAGSGS
jgi:hypothetical protein